MKLSKPILATAVSLFIGILVFLFTQLNPAVPKKGYIWQAKIEEDGNLVQVGDPYRDDEENVNVNVGYGLYMERGTGKYWFPIFSLEIYPGRVIGFQGIQLSGWNILANYCKFPTNGTYWPYCLENFLNNYYHPYNGYKRIIIRIRGYCYPTKEEADITKMEIGGEPRDLRSFLILIQGQYVDDCSECQPESNHNIVFSTDWNRGSPVGTLTRTGENTWKLDISTFIKIDPYLWEGVLEEYCECKPALHGKKPGKKSIVTSAVAGGNIHYVISFKRVPR